MVYLHSSFHYPSFLLPKVLAIFAYNLFLCCTHPRSGTVIFVGDLYHGFSCIRISYVLFFSQRPLYISHEKISFAINCQEDIPSELQIWHSLVSVVFKLKSSISLHSFHLCSHFLDHVSTIPIRHSLENVREHPFIIANKKLKFYE